MTSVTVHQLSSSWDKMATLNVDTGNFHVGVWTMLGEHPTILTQEGISIGLIQFDDEDAYTEWLSDNPDKWGKITRLLPQYHHDCQDAKAEYMLHLWDCDKCMVLLNDHSNFVKEE